MIGSPLSSIFRPTLSSTDPGIVATATTIWLPDCHSRLEVVGGSMIDRSQVPSTLGLGVHPTVVSYRLLTPY